MVQQFKKGLKNKRSKPTTDLVKLVKSETLQESRVEVFERLPISRTICPTPHLPCLVSLSN
jgi:hypothetical protein